jgi:hypothetical protein
MGGRAGMTLAEKPAALRPRFSPETVSEGFVDILLMWCQD